MANNTKRPQWRTAVEVAVISIVIYVALGAPGLSSLGPTNNENVKQSVPTARAKIESLVYPDETLSCPSHKYGVHVVTSEPLVLYIDGFLSGEEADYLVTQSQDKWQTSTIFNGGVETTDDKVRKSEKALIDRDDTVQCIEQRALAFQGWPAETFIERLWTQRYNVTGHYAYHYDWATASKISRRVSTFMVYLAADCEGGGTQFPKIARPKDARWCEFVDCSPEAEEGVTFKPRKGAAVFWSNFDAAGRGYKDTIHAGLPVTSGTKIGLNIWSWYQAGHSTPQGHISGPSTEHVA
ncbi:hypothetical protein LTR78_005342 [Recurvomyces mirabilis]|uniref:Fe2OG dioxygenase domain-containing protein n=1 Tax=Recurvomyces mirabilis TaxID=574656 RepID=A0AAE1C1B0_9PEZI|nr:hypothetical protein LTR78_005342 [Recurvomyces mirabilis]KAK5152751.1 hypothetical protein LTS14_008285 [Recurvomyces mirabilis]